MQQLEGKTGRNFPVIQPVFVHILLQVYFLQ